jgi:hypothetical protein
MSWCLFSINGQSLEIFALGISVPKRRNVGMVTRHIAIELAVVNFKANLYLTSENIHDTNIISNFNIPGDSCDKFYFHVTYVLPLMIYSSRAERRGCQCFQFFCAVTVTAPVLIVVAHFNCACGNKNGQISHSMFFSFFFICVPSSWRWPLDL